METFTKYVAVAASADYERFEHQANASDLAQSISAERDIRDSSIEPHNSIGS